jgi:membrane-associated phospholipid phosphatase
MFLAAILVLVSGALWLTGRPWGLVAGVASPALLVGVAHATRRWLKLSLHVAFATFCTAFLWPRPGATLILLTLAAVIAWSRLVLRRHTGLEVAAGGAAGLAVGALFLVVT